MTTVVNMHKAKTELSRLVAQALAGEEVIVTRSGKPVVRLVPIRKERPLGGLEGKVHVGPNFDAPLPQELQKYFEGS